MVLLVSGDTMSTQSNDVARSKESTAHQNKTK